MPVNKTSTTQHIDSAPMRKFKHVERPESTRVAHQVPKKFNIKPDLTPIGKVHVSDSAKNSIKGNLIYFYFNNLSGVYKAEENKGVNSKGTRQVDVCLAKYSKEVAEELSTGGACYTGVKWAFVNAGVIDDYGDMPKGSAKDSKAYFDKHKDKFEKVNVKKENLSKLPAGMIVVYTKDGTDGHIAITNGNGQEMSDCTDNMKWLESKGKGASYTVYRLTNNWSYDRESMKLKFNPDRK